jgi:hypothetical protein
MRTSIAGPVGLTSARSRCSTVTCRSNWACPFMYARKTPMLKPDSSVAAAVFVDRDCQAG